MVEYRNVIGTYFDVFVIPRIISFNRSVETYAASNLDTVYLTAYFNCSQIKLNSLTRSVT
jgi:hypothetical protein